MSHSHVPTRPPGLQGHAIKNQDLLIASGTIASKGSEGLSAVDDDVQAAVRLFHIPSLVFPRNSISSKHKLWKRIKLTTFVFVTAN